MSEEVEINDPEAVLAALERAKADAKKWREQVDEMKPNMDELVKVREQVQGLRNTIKEYHVDSDLRDKGLDAKRIRKYIDLSGVEVTDDGVQGLDVALATAKTDFPELFDPKRRVGGAVETGGKDATINRTVTEMQAARILGKR